MKVTKLLTKLVVDLDGTDEAPQQIVDKAVQMKKHEEQDIKNCLDLAVACGISRSSHEFFLPKCSRGRGGELYSNTFKVRRSGCPGSRMPTRTQRF